MTPSTTTSSPSLTPGTPVTVYNIPGHLSITGTVLTVSHCGRYVKVRIDTLYPQEWTVAASECEVARCKGAV